MSENERMVMICVDCRTAVMVTTFEWLDKSHQKCEDCGSQNWALENLEGYMLDELKKD